MAISILNVQYIPFREASPIIRKIMAKNTKETSPKVASEASKELKSGSASKTEKSVADSALSQAGAGKKKSTPKKK